MCEKTNWQNRAEDIVLAMDRFRSLADRVKNKTESNDLRMSAMLIRLVISSDLDAVVKNLTPEKEASPKDVLDACEKILDANRSPVPLVRLGQGDCTKDYFDNDLIKNQTLFQRASRAWKSMRGAM